MGVSTQNMQWAHGFTLLHWAAKNDMPILCSRFLFQGANPYQRDDSGKNAFDYASQRQPPSLKALEQLEKGKPAELPEFRILQTSSHPRGSKLVVGVAGL